MLKNNLILRYITPTCPVTHTVTRPTCLDELNQLTNHLWLWSGEYRNQRPYYQNRPACRVLYEQFRCELKSNWRLKYPSTYNTRDVNPHRLSVANGYNFDRTNSEVQDLLDVIPHYSLTLKNPQEIYHELHKIYTIANIEMALKILLPQTS